jgi:PPM family protein phosphatase
MHLEQQVQYASATDIGLRRRNNEDAFVVHLSSEEQEFRRRGHLFLVADGMGGHAVGELASRLAVDTVPHTLYKNRDGDARTALLNSIHAANAVIHARGSQNRDFQRMGTTCTALLLSPRGAWVGHVGDSRAYRIRRDRIDQLTFDHSLQWELQRTNTRLPDELKMLDNRNIITRSLGPEEHVDVDLEGPHAILPGDIFVVCSDGLSGAVSDEEIGGVVRELSPALACRLLVHMANLRGGGDNCTVIVVRVGDLPANAPAEPEPEPEPAPGVLGWGWLAGFWLGAMTLVAGLSMILFGRFEVGGVVTGIGAFTIIVMGLHALRRGNLFRRRHEGQTVMSRPHRTAVAQPSETLLQTLVGLEAQLRRAAQEEEWNVDWQAHRQALSSMSASQEQRRYARGVRDVTRAIDLLMSDLPKRRAMAAATMAGAANGLR